MEQYEAILRQGFSIVGGGAAGVAFVLLCTGADRPRALVNYTRAIGLAAVGAIFLAFSKHYL